MSESIICQTVGITTCPSCGQMIYSNATQCRFCSAAVDRQAAIQGAAVQARVNAACNQAKLLRNTAGAMWSLFFLGMIPFSPLGWGFTALFILLPFWLIYWQLKFGRLKTPDTDYKRAKRDWLIALGIWLPALAFEGLSIVVGLIGR